MGYANIPRAMQIVVMKEQSTESEDSSIKKSTTATAREGVLLRNTWLLSATGACQAIQYNKLMAERHVNVHAHSKSAPGFMSGGQEGRLLLLGGPILPEE